MKLFRLFNVAISCMALTMVSCSGEDGAKGDQGIPGESVKGDPGNDGDDGDDGLACWDLNKNGTADITEDTDNEDINLDGVVDALDCQGAKGDTGDNGADGADGENRPNVDFFFQNGFKGYEGTQDVQISDPGGSTNNASLNVIDNIAAPQDERFSLIRFDGLSDMINTEFDTDNVSCGDNYVVNQAILYLYCTQTLTDEITPAYLHMGFYGPTDPFFDEASATWTMANGLDNWFAPGAFSELFVGPFPNSDNYTTSMGLIFDSPQQDPGWVAIPLPREVVSGWICDDSGERNKGMRLRLSTETGAGTSAVRFFSSEADQVDLRPLLVVQTEEVDTSGKAAVGSFKKTNWEDMTYEEKMAPLRRFLSSK